MGAANGRGRRLRCDGSPAWRRSGRGRCAGGGPSRGGGASRPLLGLRFGEEDAEEAPRRAALWERRPRRPAGPMVRTTSQLGTALGFHLERGPWRLRRREKQKVQVLARNT
nr:uncharacterized protein LOC119621191 isoform X2 [Chlorocebus sabaeus]